MGINCTRKLRAFSASVLFLYLLKMQFGTAIDIITPTQSLTDGKNIVSARERFTLGFFSPSNSSHRYVGIWYTMIPETVVWIANRENPVIDFSGVLMINDKGNLVVLDGKANILWSTNASTATSNSSAKLRDTGNLVLGQGNFDINSGGVFWESFDHPTNVLLPGMKLPSNPRNSENQLPWSWKSTSDPSAGNFSVGIVDGKKLPQLVIYNWTNRYWRTGPWNGLKFIGVPDMVSFYLNGFKLDTDREGWAEISYASSNESLISFFLLDSLGKLQQLTWDEEKKELFTDWSAPDNKCDIYGICGPFGSCNPRNSAVCRCLRGFEPKFNEEWEKGNWSTGCLRRSQLKCERYGTSSIEGKGDWFLKLGSIKLPDFLDWLDAEDATLCEEKCVKNCSCVAYAYDNTMGCLFWSRDLIDIQEFRSGGMDMYIRLADSEHDKRRDVKLIIIPTVIIGTITVGVCVYFFWSCIVKHTDSGKKKDKKDGQKVLLFDIGVRMEGANNSSYSDTERKGMKQETSLELPLFDFGRLVTSTNNFSDANKLGQGGFGPVYKGKLTGGKEIAVKRLSKSSGQGLEEFKNEVVLISKLQHRNLVKLLGYCIEGEEKMLVYEYMPNKSLDVFLFDPTKQALIEWPKRFHIVEGIARGLLYLHRDSRLRIIHRDLKASNILLDGELNPKISDFGLARIFGGNQIQADTRRVVGTYGYMSPEYAMEGRFSEKSDVFSFGVLLLEIVSGKKNTSFYYQELTLNLLSYAWKLWNEEKLLELIDPELGDSFSQAEVLRCIQVGLLCVQEFAADRPTMSSIVFMLSCEIVSLPTPKQPAFTEKRASELGTEIWSVNIVSNTMLQGRYTSSHIIFCGSMYIISNIYFSPSMFIDRVMGINCTRKLRAFPASVLFLYLLKMQFGTAIDIITPTQSLTDGKNIVSARERFTLGFFSPSNSSHRYVGIWYTMIPETVVWIANRENPVIDFSGVLMINDKGNLVVLDGKANILWSTNASTATSNPSAKLRDTGNLVLGQGNFDINGGGVFWESFDHPTNVMLPGMKLRSNPRNNENQMPWSWKSSSDPSVGNFSVGIVDGKKLPQLVIYNWSNRYWRTGPWNGLKFIGVPDMVSFYLNGFKSDPDSEGWAAISYGSSNESLISFFDLDSLGKLQQLTWDEEKKELFTDWSAADNKCDVYGICGPFGSCNPRNSAICRCMRGFEPKFNEEWEKGNWSTGCLRRNQLNCERNGTSSIEGKGDWFLKLGSIKLPDFLDWSDAKDATLCEEKCVKNCSCVAYAYVNILGCSLWSRDLIDIQEFSSGGMDMYIRLADSEHDKRRDVKLIIIPTVIIGTITVGVCVYFFWSCIVKHRDSGKKKDKKDGQKVLLFDIGVRMEGANNSSYSDTERKGMKQETSLELPLFDFGRLVTSTNNFSDANKLGQGGFGPVYKGKLTGGKEIAVKRLSKSSGQGLEEFKNEVVLISKLQHRNLVKLLGYCIEGEEKMLVYEYMPNKSLDVFLFDPTKQALLEWPKRFHIVEGIARGLLYLHRDSRLRIIHRDLKASNILLDGELNPKISDFGLARIFGGNQIQADTRRVVGTYGYMSPEYAMEGRFSEKSDVFSFGVLLLEIVSGKKNTSFYHHELTLNLLSYAWKLWNEEKLIELIDPELGDSFSLAEVLRCIQVGLLCVQEFAADRPTMSSVVFMLSCEIASLPTPKQPAFTEKRASELGTEIWSVNNVSITLPQGR
ncbi:uncharacterized protein LOC143885627 [Tasmannia lanceolata]|uniref:uncharacterized protein LOC143885627 n=1 Tax=Tasmannia lanceolata TaxID=3420 RepID=UPI004063FA58